MLYGLDKNLFFHKVIIKDRHWFFLQKANRKLFRPELKHSLWYIAAFSLLKSQIDFTFCHCFKDIALKLHKKQMANKSQSRRLLRQFYNENFWAWAKKRLTTVAFFHELNLLLLFGLIQLMIMKIDRRISEHPKSSILTLSRQNTPTRRIEMSTKTQETNDWYLFIKPMEQKSPS